MITFKPKEIGLLLKKSVKYKQLIYLCEKMINEKDVFAGVFIFDESICDWSNRNKRIGYRYA